MDAWVVMTLYHLYLIQLCLIYTTAVMIMYVGPLLTGGLNFTFCGGATPAITHTSDLLLYHTQEPAKAGSFLKRPYMPKHNV